ncbi:MAG TPA: response regulator [Chitinophagales bacterium]|nr:response regulator [Chitinophagales bacterium]
MSHDTRYILIDDDRTNNLLCDFVIRDADPLADVHSFTDAEAGLEQLVSFLRLGCECVVLLDINMPVLSGWDVLEHLGNLPAAVQKNMTVFMLSSSVSVEDKQRALSNPLVSDYFEKPLTAEKVGTLMKIQRSKAAA